MKFHSEDDSCCFQSLKVAPSSKNASQTFQMYKKIKICLIYQFACDQKYILFPFKSRLIQFPMLIRTRDILAQSGESEHFEENYHICHLVRLKFIGGVHQ